MNCNILSHWYFVDDEYDEEMLCAMLEDDHSHPDEGSNFFKKERWIFNCFMCMHICLLCGFCFLHILSR